MITLKNKKQLMVIVLALFMAFAIVGTLFTGLKKNVVKADGDTSYFAMEDGISIKLNEDGGMRFIVKMDTTTGEALINGEETMQFIIAPTALFDYADQNGMEYINLPKKIVVDVDSEKVYPDNADEPNYYYANGCVTKMYESNFNLTYEAVGYIVGERYTARNSNATGTYYEKVNATFINQNLEEQILGLERYNGWYGTEKYPIAIKNQGQYEKIVEKCNAGNTAYKGKVIIAENGVQWNDADFTNPATKPELSKTANILADEISTWDESEVVGGALNSSNVAYKIGGYNVYKTTGGYGQSIVNTNIVATNHTELHFAFKVDKSVYLSSGNSNTVKANTWYFVKLEKQTGGNWTIAVKAFGESSYTTLEASTEFFGAGNATFEKMFRTYLWAGNNTDNHEVYATDVWGVTKVDEEIATWEAAGAIKLGSALNSSEALAETLGGLAIYKTNGGFNKSIANLSIDASNYTKLYFAYKTNKPVALSNTDGQNGNKAGVWYFVKLEKQTDGSWTIAAKAFGDSSYTTLTANAQLFGTNATFDSMFKTNLWTNDAYNHEVYATDVWGVTVVGGEVATWEAAGAENLGSALNSSEALAETLGGLAVYKTTGGYGQSIVNTNIVATNHTELHFAFKVDKSVYLSSGNSNTVKANTWYFVKLEKQTGGNWTIAVKAFGESSYTTLEASSEFFGAGNATFEKMFRTYLWAGNNTDNHEVYATDVWGVTKVDEEIATWEAAGAIKLGSALNSSEALAETLGGLAIYKTNGGFNKSIANLSIDASNYTKLYFAYKTNKSVALSNTDGQNGNKAGVWYFVKLEKQADGSWTIAAKAFGDSSYTTLTANAQLFGANATFDSMFKTNLWTNDAYNHEVYATDVWGVTVVGGEVAAWESAGAVKLGSALNSSEALDEKLGGLAVYKTTGGYGQSIVNTGIVASNYTELHFAFKTNKNVTLSNGNGGVNAISADTWYFVRLEKQTDGSWTISVKVFGASDYTAWTADAQFFGADKATFDLMFRTYLWAGNNTDNHEVYATDVWGK